MAKRKKESGGAVDRAADAVGRALGSVAGTIESLQAQHPHPLEETREALAAGQETLSAVASKAGARAAGLIKKAKALAQPDEEGRKTRSAEEHAGEGPSDTHGTEGSEAREEDRETGGGAQEALALDHAVLLRVPLLRRLGVSNSDGGGMT